MPESFSPEHARAAREHELRNAEVIERILVSGSDDEMKELQELHGATPEQMETLRHYARLRDSVHHKELHVDRPKTPEEEQVGIYFDYIEPQVLEAVRTFTKKGYKTYYSGFEQQGGAQTMWFEGGKDLTESFPQDVKDEIEGRWNVKISFKPGEVWVDCMAAKLNIEELTEIWNKIAEAIV